MEADEVSAYLAGRKAKNKAKQTKPQVTYKKKKKDSSPCMICSINKVQGCVRIPHLTKRRSRMLGCVRSPEERGSESWLQRTPVLPRSLSLSYQGFVMIFRERRKRGEEKRVQKGRRGGSISIQNGAHKYQTGWDGPCHLSLICLIHICHREVPGTALLNPGDPVVNKNIEPSSQNLPSWGD